MKAGKNRTTVRLSVGAENYFLGPAGMPSARSIWAITSATRFATERGDPLSHVSTWLFVGAVL